MSTPIIRQRKRHSSPASDPSPLTGPTTAEPLATSESPKEYAVGRGKPPRNRRFGEPGGNKPGRKPGSQNLATLIRKELDKKVSVVQDGRERRYTKRELLARATVNKAVQGSPRHFQLLQSYLDDRSEEAERSDAANAVLDLKEDGREALRKLHDLMNDGPPPGDENG